MLNKFWSIAQCWRLPAVCVLCHHYHRETFALCQACTDLLVPAPPSPGGGNVDRIYTAYAFEEPLRTLLHLYKYQGALYLRQLFLKLLLDAKPTLPYQADCLTPVPMHPQRLRERGFNHAAVLGKLLAKSLDLPYERKLCQKIINTPQQASLGGRLRRQNLKQAFVAEASPYAHVVLVDDLLTTGATADAVAHALKQQGVVRVDLWCLARVC